MNDPYISLADLDDSSRLIAKEISGRRGLELNGMPFENLRKDILKRLEGWRPTNKSCPALTLVLEQSLTPAGLLSVSGIWNGVAASFKRTLFDFYQNFGFKLAPYASVDPEKDIGLFYDSLISQTQFGILGLTPGDINLQYALSEFYYKAPKQTEPLQIPFSPMLASSLTISLFFWLYIILIYSSRVSLKLLSYFKILTDKVEIESAPFTFIIVGSGAVSMIIYVALQIANGAWEIMFGSFS